MYALTDWDLCAIMWANSPLEAYMIVKIARIGDSDIVAFALDELRLYLARMDPGADILCLAEEVYDPARTDVLWVGLSDALSARLPTVHNPKLDDAICLDVEGAHGVVTGTNARAVLLGVYRLLRENGCRFLRPGVGGEYVPQRRADSLRARVWERAAHRHRGMCIEGAVSYQNVLDMIDWLPKAGMNAYFLQFFAPTAFFARWYEHHNNESLPVESVSRTDALGMRTELEREIRRRGLLYHAVGHGWTCEPLGIPGETWDESNYEVPCEAMQHLAEVGGVRSLSGGIPLDTNLCYGNPQTRSLVVDYAVRYLVKHPKIDYLHFWLGDNQNNHCECPLCRDTRPSDFYLMLLNALDARLTELRINTRIVFLVYIDLLWAPERERLDHPDRFVLMFAPITRTYTRSFLPDEPFHSTLPPYRRNANAMPTGVAENVAMLEGWRAMFDGDSFDFDYHMMYDHHRDAGGFEMARILVEDVGNLRAIGLNGMISCQNQRAAFPTALGLYGMARALWAGAVDFEEMAAEFCHLAFGHDGGAVVEYLRGLSTLLKPAYLRLELSQEDAALAERFASAKQHIDGFLPLVKRNLRAAEDDFIRGNWEMLRLHTDLATMLSQALAHRARGERPQMLKVWQAAAAYTRSIEPRVQPLFDVYEYIKTLQPFFERDAGPIF